MRPKVSDCVESLSKAIIFPRKATIIEIMDDGSLGMKFQMPYDARMDHISQSQIKYYDDETTSETKLYP